MYSTVGECCTYSTVGECCMYSTVGECCMYSTVGECCTQSNLLSKLHTLKGTPNLYFLSEVRTSDQY